MISKDTLPNGMRLVIEELPYVHSACIGIWVGTGSRHEQPEILGVSHFLEHMFFKGTKNRTAKQIAESLEEVGGQLNAFTSKEHTCYYAKVLSEDFDLAADVLSDMFLNSLFSTDDIKKEKNVIMEEIKMYEDTPDELVHDLYTATVWKDDSLGQAIIGTAETVGHAKRSQLSAYYKSRYYPENVVIAVAGNVQRSAVLEKISSLFAGFRRKGTAVETGEVKTSSGYNFVNKDIEQVHLCLGVPGLSQKDPQIYVLHVLNNILGGGVSSRLFQEVREDRGLTYTIYSYHSAYTNAGLFGIYAGTSYETAAEVVDITLAQILDIRNNGVTPEELRRTKQQIKGNLLLGLESVSGRMTRIGKSELTLGKIITPEEIVERVMQVSNESIMALANQLFQREQFSLAVIGPKEPTFSWADALNRAGF